MRHTSSLKKLKCPHMNKIYPIAFSTAALMLLLIAILVHKLDYGFYKLLRWSVVIACGVNVYHLSNRKGAWAKIISIPLILIIPLFLFAKMQRSEWIHYDIGAMAIIFLGGFSGGQTWKC